ncbi:MAG TPA: alpha/beta fold hydrolase [Streptosporangiaceae bacterium]
MTADQLTAVQSCRPAARQELWLGPPTMTGPTVTGTLPLLCLPHAGGGASVYRPWMRSGLPGLPWVTVVPVRLPGREQRAGETPFTDMEFLLDAALAALAGVLAGPYAVYGHSMGALIAFELARRARDLAGHEPVRLLVSGQRAPGQGVRPVSLSRLPDDELIRSLQELGGLPAAVRENRELLALMLPRVRADLGMYEKYEYRPGRPLSCPVSVFGSLDDNCVAPRQLQSWRHHTSGEAVLRIFNGGHFFHLEHQREMLAAIADDLRGDWSRMQPDREAL